MPDSSLSPRELRLETAKASPIKVGAHDKEGWLSLFAPDGQVEDPKGIPPHRKGASTIKKGQKTDDLELFYENFVAPNQVGFEALSDWVVGDNVCRDVVIETALSTGLVVRIPAHLFYELVEIDGAMKVKRLEAHWDAKDLNRQAASHGFFGYRTLLSSGFAMLRSFGLKGTQAYNEGIKTRVGRHGKAAVEAFAEAVNADDGDALLELFASPDAEVEMPVGGGAIQVKELLDGPAEDAKLTLGELISCSWWVTCSFELEKGGEKHAGLARFEFDRETRKIADARLFWEA